MEDPANEGTGLFMSKLPEFVYVLATYEPTPAQRMEVKKNAALVERRIASNSKLKKKENIIVVEVTPKMVPPPTQPPSTSAASKAKAAVMLWDTKAQEIIGNKVYEISSVPKVGKVLKWDTHTVQYFGAGL